MRPAWLIVPLAVFVGGCSSCHKESPPGESRAATLAVESPVPAPEDLLAELVVTAPDATWGKLQKGIGGATALFPMTTGGLICALGGIDPSLGAEIDGASPIYGALALDHGEVVYAFAVKLVEARRAQTVLVDGEGARYAAKEGSGMTILSAKGGASARAALAIARGGYLLVASSPVDLARLGPYVHRTLPTRPLPSSAGAIEVPHAALAGIVKTTLLADWAAFRNAKAEQDAKMRQEHGGRAPDFADPAGILGIVDGLVQTRVALLADLERAKLTLDVGEDQMKAELTLVPMDGNGPAAQLVASMHPESARSVLDAPADALLAISMRGVAAERAASGRDFEDALSKALGERLGADGQKKLHAAVTDWSSGRGDELSGWLVDGKARGVFVRTAASDPEAATRALREAGALLTTPAFKTPLKTLLLVEDVTFGASDVPGLGKVDAAMLVLPKELKSKLGFAWFAKGSEVSAAFSDDPTALLARGANAKRSVGDHDARQALGDDASISTAVNALGADTTFALVAQPLAHDPTGAPAPLVFGWGRRGPNLWARADLSDRLVRAAMKRAGGF